MQEHQQQQQQPQNEHNRQTSISTISAKRTQQQSPNDLYRNASNQPELRPLTVSQLDLANNGLGRTNQRLNRQDSDTSSFAGRRTRLKESQNHSGGSGSGGGGGGVSTNSKNMHSNEAPTAVLVNSAGESRHRRCGSTNSTRSQLRKPSSSSGRNSSAYGGSMANSGSSRSPNDPTSITSKPASQFSNPSTHQQRHQQSHQSSSTAANVSSSSNTNNNSNRPASDRSDDERLSNAADSTGERRRMHRRRRSRRRNKHGMSGEVMSSSSASSSSSSSAGSSTGSSCNGSCSSDDGDSSTSSGEPNLPYPGFPEVALKYLTQDTRPRNWCLMLITNPYPFQKHMLSALRIKYEMY